MNEGVADPILFEKLEEVVLPIIAITRDLVWHPVGTAFVIASPAPQKRAFVLTAAHNLTKIRDLDSPPRHHPSTPKEFLPQQREWTDLRHTHVHMILDVGGRAHLAEMQRAWYRVGFDAALCIVDLRTDQDAVFPSQLELDSRPVVAGTSVMVVGYPEMTAKMSLGADSNSLGVEFGRRIEYRMGKVTEVCPQGTYFHRWPGFLTDCPIDSGMSGGPVIDLSGDTPRVRGLLGGDRSESADALHAGSGGQAFSSMLWPVMATETQIELKSENGDLVVDKARLVDLVRHGLVRDAGRAHEHFQMKQEGELIVLSWV